MGEGVNNEGIGVILNLIKGGERNVGMGLTS